jgi:hypothetical protein
MTVCKRLYRGWKGKTLPRHPLNAAGYLLPTSGQSCAR